MYKFYKGTHRDEPGKHIEPSLNASIYVLLFRLVDGVGLDS